MHSTECLPRWGALTPCTLRPFPPCPGAGQGLSFSFYHTSTSFLATRGVHHGEALLGSSELLGDQGRMCAWAPVRVLASIAPAHYLPAPPGRRPVFAFSHLRSKASRGASALLYYSSQAGQGTLGPFMLGPSLGRPPEEVVGVVLCFMLESASIGHGQLPSPVLHQSQDAVSYPSDMVYVSPSLLRKTLDSTHVSTDSVL